MSATYVKTGSRRRAAWLYLILPTMFILVLFFIVPLLSLFWTSFHQYVPGKGITDTLTWGYYTKFLSDIYYIGILIKTILLGIGVTLATLLLGYPVAYFIARTNSERKGFYFALIIFPLFLNIVVRSFAWIVILANRGLVNDLLIKLGLLATPVKMLYNYFGVMVGMTHVFLPFMVLAVATAIRNVDRSCEEAAMSLGANRARTFWSVTLPLSMPGVLGGSLLVFLLSITAFVTPRLLGGVTVKVISNLIYQQFMFTGNWPFGAAIGFILLAFTLIIIVGYFRTFKMSESQG